MKQQTSPMQLLVSIAQRGDGGALMRQYGSFHLDQHFQSTGHGTAASHLLDTLGFGTSERDILLTIGPKDTIRQLMLYLKDSDRPELGPGASHAVSILAVSPPCWRWASVK